MRPAATRYLLLAAWFTPSLAHAHAFLETASPAVGATVTAAPKTLSLRFSEGVEPDFCSVAVSDAQGGRVDDGAARAAPGDDRTLLIGLGRMPPGSYLVSWHAVSVDTHRTEGTFHFTVAAP